jgi:hypothetical protein
MLPVEPQRPYGKERWPGQVFTFCLGQLDLGIMSLLANIKKLSKEKNAMFL